MEHRCGRRRTQKRSVAPGSTGFLAHRLDRERSPLWAEWPALEPQRAARAHEAAISYQVGLPSTGADAAEGSSLDVRFAFGFAFVSRSASRSPPVMAQVVVVVCRSVAPQVRNADASLARCSRDPITRCWGAEARTDTEREANQ